MKSRLTPERLVSEEDRPWLDHDVRGLFVPIAGGTYRKPELALDLHEWKKLPRIADYFPVVFNTGEVQSELNFTCGCGHKVSSDKVRGRVYFTEWEVYRSTFIVDAISLCDACNSYVHRKMFLPDTRQIIEFWPGEFRTYGEKVTLRFSWWRKAYLWVRWHMRYTTTTRAVIFNSRGLRSPTHRTSEEY